MARVVVRIHIPPHHPIREAPMIMSREEAIAQAKDVARHHRWVWTGEIRATLHQPIPVLGWLLGRHPVWRVVSNADDVGYNVRVTIDAETRVVLNQRFGSG